MKRLITLLAVCALAAGLAGTAQPAPSQKNIVQTAVAAGQFTTLAKLLTRAGLVGALQKPGPYTVFAPTDAAFAKVPKSTLKLLLADKAKLKAVLLYHVVRGKVTAQKVAMLSSAKTLNGQIVRIRTTGGNAYVNRARVTKADVTASNGVIHVVDRVLVPPSL